MDTLTHALSGALLARAMAPRDPRPDDITVGGRMLAGALAAAFPDSDVVLSFVSPVAYLTLHRGPTHSLLLAPFFALVLAWIFGRVARKPWRAFYGVALGGILIHIVGDWITSFGTLMLWPLSDHRFALSTTFIIDLWFSAIIVAGLALSGVWRRSRVPATAALVVLAGYVMLQERARMEAIDFGRAETALAGRSAEVSALPRPVSPFNWLVIADEGDRYRYANVRLSPEPALLARLSPWIAALGAPYAQPQDVTWDVAFKFGPDSANREIAEAAWQAPGLAFFRWFAEAPLTVEITHRPPGPCVWFQDLRFLTPGREAWPFRYGACRRDGGPWRAFGWNGGEPLAID